MNILPNSAYGIIDDDNELFAKFLNMNQDSGAKHSGYLKTILIKVIKKDRQIISCLSSSVEAAGIRAYLPVFSLNRGRMTHLPSPSYSFGCVLRRKANGKARIAALKPSLSLSQVPAKPGEKEKAESKAPVEENPPLSPEPKLTNKKPRPWYSPTCSIERRVCEDWHPQWPSYVWATSIFCLTWWGVCRVLPRHPAQGPSSQITCVDEK